MTPRANGLERDLNLLRRRWWLFIPFLILGVIAALAFGSVAGQSNSVATLSLNTVVFNVLQGGDRGFRIFEASQMTKSPEFAAKVVAATGEPDFDYGRYAISLAAISVGDGVADGTLTVSIKDDDKVKADKYRQAFVDTFIHEYREPDGLFRTRFTAQVQQVADDANAEYVDLYAQLSAMAKAKYPDAPIEQLVQAQQPPPLLQELGKQQAQLQGQLAQVKAAETTAATNPDAGRALAASALQTTVTGDPVPVLKAAETGLTTAIADLQKQIAGISDGAYDEAFQSLLAHVRSQDQVRREAYNRVADASSAGASAKSEVSTSYSASGGLAASTMGRSAVIVAFGLVFGLIAIYGIEWLSQIRANQQD